MSFENVLTKVTELQAEIVGVEAKLKALRQDLQQSDAVKAIHEVEVDLKNKLELYKAYTKENFGIADGEATSVFDIAKAIRKIAAFD